MADYKVTDAELISIANAIRTKGGTSAQLEFPSGFISAINAIPTGSVEIVPWSTGTDAQIAAMIQAAHNGDIDLQVDGGWVVGDARTITIPAFSAGGTSFTQAIIPLVITSFDDYNNCGCVMQFDFKHTTNEGVRMHSAASSVSYDDTEMKNETIPALQAQLPTWLKDMLIQFSAPTNYNGASVGSVAKLSIRSEAELFGSNAQYIHTTINEGSQLDYYNEVNNRKKFYNNQTTNATKYWTRTAYAGDRSYYAYCSESGRIEQATVLRINNSTPRLAVFGCL